MKRLKRKKKKPFTLLEISLAFSILSLILVFLFSTFRSCILLSSQVDHVRHLIFSRHHLHERLSQLFLKVESCVNPLLEIGEQAFYTPETSADSLPSSLYFAFDNGVDPEIEFCGIVYGHLFVEQGHLILEVSPLKEKKSSKRRKECLFKNVSSSGLTFYKRPNALEISKNLELYKEWPLKHSDVPYYVTLSLQLQDTTLLEYSFYLSSKIQPICYEL
jgi:type II secretory pathway component PulJ